MRPFDLTITESSNNKGVYKSQVFLMDGLLDFVDPLNAMMEDEETIKELFRLYPKQDKYIRSRYNDETVSAYYLCLVHLCKKFKCKRFRMGRKILSLNPELRAS